MKHTRKEENFINHVKKVSRIYNQKYSLRNTTYVKADNNIKCAGWFEEDGDGIVVAMNGPEAIEILVHEYCHLTQFVENNKIWQKGNDSCMALSEWLSGEKVRNIKRHIDNVKLLELDNEKRTVKTIQDFNLNIDTTNYIKKANAYIHFYNWIKYTRRWSRPDNSPRNNKKIISLMSSKFNMNYSDLSPKMFRVFEEENI